MGCINSRASSEGGGLGIADGPWSVDRLSKTNIPTLYITADPGEQASFFERSNYVVPDLGWRNTTNPNSNYPLWGFCIDFQNERSGYILRGLDLISLATNIAERASKLANRYGVTDPTIHSSSNLLEDLNKRRQEEGWSNDVVLDMNKVRLQRDDNTLCFQILKAFGCPNYNWRLLGRAIPSGPLLKNTPEIFCTGAGAAAEHASGDVIKASVMSELAKVPDFLQQMQDSNGKLVVLDVAEVGMNVAEQLFRLEKSENTDNRVPNNSFGWQPLSSPPEKDLAARESLYQPICSPDGEALLLIPEELIMHVASWVQQTYLTAPAF